MPVAVDPEALEATRRKWETFGGPEVAKAFSASPQKANTLFGLMLEKDRQSFLRDLAPGSLDAHRQRLLMQQVARVLNLAPYGSSKQQLLQALHADPHVHAVAPDLTLAEVAALARLQSEGRRAFFQQRGGTALEAMSRALDMPMVSDSKANPFEAFEKRQHALEDLKSAPSVYLRDPERKIDRLEHGYPYLDDAIDIRVTEAVKEPATGQKDLRERYSTQLLRQMEIRQGVLNTLAGPVAPELMVLRKTVLEAPPHWTLERVAQEHNQHAQYYAPFTQGAKTFGAEELRFLLRTHRKVLGSDEFFLRRTRFQTSVRDALMASKPGENLYAVLNRVSLTLTQSPDIVAIPSQEIGERNSNATVTPDELLDYVVGNETLCRELDESFSIRQRALKSSIYPPLAKRVLEVFGDRLHGFSLYEIAARMQLDDPSFNEGLLCDLVAECPELFGAEPFARAQRNFVLATQVAHRMHFMWAGATHEDVAEFMKSLGPLGQVPPDFTANDVELLQGYDFVPKWPNGIKPDSEAEREQLAQSQLMRELDTPLSLVPSADAVALRGEFLRLLMEGGPSKALPPSLEQQVDQVFSRALMHRVLDSFTRNSGHTFSTDNPEGAKLRRILDGDLIVDRAELGTLLRSAGATGGMVVNSNLLVELIDQISNGRLDALFVEQPWQTVGKSLVEETGSRRTENIEFVLRSFQSAAREVKLRMEVEGFRSEETRRVMARYNQIPLTLETTQAVVEKVKQERHREGRPLPFESARVVMIQHELGQAYPQVEAFRQLGMDPAKCIFVGVPYHPNSEVEEALVRSSGVDGRFAEQGDLGALKRNIEQAVDDAVAARTVGEKVLIVCDGPHARRYFEEKYLAAQPRLAEVVCFTEQTSRGHRPDDEARTNLRVVSSARDPQKVREAPYIGRAAVRSVEKIMHAMRDTLENKVVLIKALGPVGRAACESAAAAGAKVIAYDENLTPEMIGWAAAIGIELTDEPDEVAKRAHAVLGGAGARSIDGKTIDARQGVQYVGSLSSELWEIDLPHLEKQATDEQGILRRALAAQVNGQPTYFYWLNNGSVRVLMGGGLPINFDDINSVAPEIIDFTMALGLASSVEAIEGDALGFHSLQRYSDFIHGSYDRYLERLGGGE